MLSALSELGIQSKEIDYILLTHIHMDHAGGIGTVIKEMSNARVLAHSRARSHLIAPTMLWEASLKTLGDAPLRYGKIEPVPEERIIDAVDEMKLELGNSLTLEIYLTPGHASHHLCLFDRASSALIVGEAAGVCVDGAIRPNMPPPFKLEDALSSIDKLIALKPQKLCYAHFGCYDNGLERLKSFREQLLSWYNTVKSATDAGRRPEEILMSIREEDKGLDYLDSLDGDEYARELVQLFNTIYGLAGSV